MDDNCDATWNIVINLKYGGGGDGFWNSKHAEIYFGVARWKQIAGLWGEFKNNIKLKVDTGMKTRLWNDRWSMKDVKRINFQSDFWATRNLYVLKPCLQWCL